jgi:hypothetical protein
VSAAGTLADAGCGPLDGYLGRDPDRWRGFTGETRASLIACYKFNAGEGAATLGERGVAYGFRTLSRPSCPAPFVFYFAQDRLACISADYWSLDERECRAVLGRLGPPPHRLDACFRESVLREADWVFPARGLALCVVPETGLIARWTAYAPCPLEMYRARYRVTEPAREFD